MSNQTEHLDKWEELLEIQIKILKQCQSTKSLNSCTPCEHLIECDTRKAYIESVYESMNKGSGGGFEF
jgi:hypothetical protein